MNDLAHYEELLRSILKVSGIESSASLQSFNSVKLSDYKNSVLELRLNYELGGEEKSYSLIQRSFSEGKYPDSALPKIKNEVFFSQKMPEWMEGQGFKGLPFLKYKITPNEDDFRSTVLYQEKVGDYNLAEVLPGYSVRAKELESKIASSNELNIEENKLDRNVLKELEAFGRIRYKGNGLSVALKPKIQRLHDDWPNYLHSDNEKTLNNVFETILDFNKAATDLARYNQDVIDASKNVEYSRVNAIRDFKESLLKLNPNSKGSALFRALGEDYRKFVVDHYLKNHLPYSLVHGDMNASNIILGDRGVFLIDFGHIMSVKNPLIDFADSLKYQLYFCGLSQENYGNLWNRVLSETHSTPNHRYFTELVRDVEVLGMLAKRIRNSNDPEHLHHRGHNLEGMKYRFPKYLESVNKLINKDYTEVDFGKSKKRDDKLKKFCDNLNKFMENISLEKIIQEGEDSSSSQ